MTKRTIASALAAMAFAATAQAQIGYQVSLLNTATGEPRANVTVSAEVTITDSEGNTIHTGTQQATTNDFGVLSLTVGDAATFANADTGKMPFFIAVSVDGTLIGRSQILSVPVAEVANRLKSSFTKEDLVGTWKYSDGFTNTLYTFSQDGTMNVWNKNGDYPADTYYYNYEIEGNTIFCYGINQISANGNVYDNSSIRLIRWTGKGLYDDGGGNLTKQ